MNSSGQSTNLKDILQNKIDDLEKEVLSRVNSLEEGKYNPKNESEERGKIESTLTSLHQRISDLEKGTPPTPPSPRCRRDAEQSPSAPSAALRPPRMLRAGDYSRSGPCGGDLCSLMLHNGAGRGADPQPGWARWGPSAPPSHRPEGQPPPG